MWETLQKKRSNRQPASCHLVFIHKLFHVFFSSPGRSQRSLWTCEMSFSALHSPPNNMASILYSLSLHIPTYTPLSYPTLSYTLSPLLQPLIPGGSCLSLACVCHNVSPSHPPALNQSTWGVLGPRKSCSHKFHLLNEKSRGAGQDPRLLSNLLVIYPPPSPK